MTDRASVYAAQCSGYQDAARLRSALELVIAPQIAKYGSLSGRKLMLKPNLLAWRRNEDYDAHHDAKRSCHCLKEY